MNFITVTIPFDRTGFGRQNEVQKTLEDLVIELIKSNSQITIKEMALKVGKSKATVERFLKSNSKIYYVGPSKSGHWEIEE